MCTEQEFNHIKLDIEAIVARAQEIIMPKIAPVNNVIADIKEQLVHGTDRIPTSQLHEWGLVLSVASTELTPHKEAYALSSALWSLDIKKSNAKNLAQRRQEQKKVDIENQNVIDSADKETQKVILDYMSGMLGDTQESISKMLSEINRIIDARIRNNEAK